MVELDLFADHRLALDGQAHAAAPRQVGDVGAAASASAASTTTAPVACAAGWKPREIARQVGDDRVLDRGHLVPQSDEQGIAIGGVRFGGQAYALAEGTVFQALT